jgi:hypothetical protein
VGQSTTGGILEWSSPSQLREGMQQQLNKLQSLEHHRYCCEQELIEVKNATFGSGEGRLKFP